MSSSVALGKIMSSRSLCEAVSMHCCQMALAG